MNPLISFWFVMTTQFSAQQKQQLIETDKVAVLTNVQIIEPLKYLCRCLKKYCHVNLQDNGLLESEQYCCQILAWFCSLCDVSEGFTISLAEILSEEQSILAAQMPVRFMSMHPCLQFMSHICVCVCMYFYNEIIFDMCITIRNGWKLSS